MKFRGLQDNLRKELLKRIDAGELTGLKLAHMTGFQQAHISNFLNKKRGLSIEGMDKVLSVQKLSVLDLLDPAEVNKRASIPAPSPDEFENVLLVEGAIAAGQDLVISDQVKDILKFKKAFLRRLRAEMQTPREGWTRFVLVKVDANDGMSMYPRLLPGATILIDRHYNSLKPYRKNEQNMYAVRKSGTTTVKYLELQGSNLILRPHNQAYPVDVIGIEDEKTYADYIIGRVCHVAIEA
jgi:hypothetical protein